MKLFEASFEAVIWRFYLLMAVVILSFFAGVPILAILALPIFLSAMLGIQFVTSKNGKVLNINQQKKKKIAA